MILNDLHFRILVAIYEEQQKGTPNMSNIKPKKFQVSHREFARAIKSLNEGGLLTGVVIREGGEYPFPFYVSLDSGTVTLTGENVMRESGKI
jgi:hypothetical protein